MARASLFLDLGKRKVPLARESEPSFRLPQESDKLDMHAGVRSDWPDLNNLCIWTGVDSQ